MTPRLLLAPSNSPLPDSLRISSTSSSLPRIFAKLSRSSVLDLAIQWLQPQCQQSCPPFLAEDLDEEDDDSAYPPAESLEELIETYNELQNRKGAKGEVIDRILEGDWRHGISLRQLAMLDMQYLIDHPTSQKWTVLKLGPLTTENREPSKKRQKTEHDAIPRFHALTFLRNLQSEISPIVKAHYHVHRPVESLQLPMTILRIYITDTPYKNPAVSKIANLSLTDTSKTIYVAFPDSCPYVYISLNSTALFRSKSSASSSSDTRVLKKLVLDAIPKALSSQHNRYKIETTSLSAKSLSTLLNLRGNGRTNNSQGVFTVFSSGGIEESPLDPALSQARKEDSNRGSVPGKENRNPYPTPENTQPLASQPSASQKADNRRQSFRNASNFSEESALRLRKAIAASRFGSSATDPEDGTGLDRFEIRLEEPLPAHLSLDSASSQQQPSDATSRSISRKRKNPLDSFEPHAPNSDKGQDRLGIRVTFTGTHIFAGIRGLVERGVIDGEKMPRWMTGEEGVSVGVVRDGRLLRKH